MGITLDIELFLSVSVPVHVPFPCPQIQARLKLDRRRERRVAELEKTFSGLVHIINQSKQGFTWKVR